MQCHRQNICKRKLIKVVNGDRKEYFNPPSIKEYELLESIYNHYDDLEKKYIYIVFE